MKFGVIIELGPTKVHWCKSKTEADAWLTGWLKSNPNHSGGRYTIVEVMWSIAD